MARRSLILACIFDEIAYWRDDSSANPDLEVFRAVKPSLARTGGMLVGISSPYRRAGLLHQRFKDYYDTDDADVLVVKGGTAQFNPTISQATIAKEYAADPESARSEWGAEFRSDVASLFDDIVIDDAIDHARPLELPPRGGRRYYAFANASAGRHDAFTLCIAHCEGKPPDALTWTADVVRGHPAPFDPRSVAQEFASLARGYGCPKIVGDHFAGEWVASAFRDCGINYETSPLPKSQLYLESLPAFNRGAVSIPDHPTLQRELRGLERRVHRSGRDTVDHPSRGSDDYANAVCGALYLAVHEARRPKMRTGAIGAQSTGMTPSRGTIAASPGSLSTRTETRCGDDANPSPSPDALPRGCTRTGETPQVRWRPGHRRFPATEGQAMTISAGAMVTVKQTGAMLWVVRGRAVPENM